MTCASHSGFVALGRVSRQHALRALLLLMLAAAAVPAARAQIYSEAGDSDAVVLSNHPSTPDAVLLVDAPPAAAPVPAATSAPAVAELPARSPPRPATPTQITSIVRAAASKHALPEALLLAMVAVESAFNDRAVSPKGAKGLMQLMPDTARRVGVTDVFSPDQNVHAGAAYMRVLMNQFAGDLSLALAAYNAGEGAVLRAGRRIPAYPETQHYVRKVLAQAAIPADRSVPLRR